MDEEERQRIRGFSHPPIFHIDPFDYEKLLDQIGKRLRYHSREQLFLKSTPFAEVTYYGNDDQTRSESAGLSPANDTQACSKDGDEPAYQE